MPTKRPYALRLFSQKFPQYCLWNDSNVRLVDDGLLSSFQGRSSSASSFHASLLQAISGVTSLALFQHVESQAPQHFLSCEMDVTFDVGFPTGLSAPSFPSTFDVSRAELPQTFSKVDTKHWHMPVWASHFRASCLCVLIIQFSNQYTS